MNRKTLRFLEQVSRFGSMRKAAENLNISSSALNRQILSLEEEVGMPLFERLPRKLRLTAAGEVLVAHAQAVERDYRSTMGRIAALKGMGRGTIRLSTMGGLIYGPLLTVACDFIRQHSRMLVRVEIQPSPEMIAARVLSGESDIGLGYNILPNPGLRVLQSIEVDIGAVVAPGHPLTRKDGLRLSDCIHHPIVTGTDSMAIRSVMDHAFATADIPLQPTVETDSIEVIKQFAMSGNCITFLNPFDISAEIDRGALVWLPLAERYFPIPSLRLVTRSKGVLEPATARLVEEIKTRMGTEG
ncbi:LysR family transcriptional regulator [Rhizobium ecuadorense]|uniref:LysR family transcriptional regulator n=1 Tax=Rhizobium ecuadorense TaxID=1671795 RepID=UPI00067349F8|nr:LysR family transcriptional regulator [Rhizobium ecuadorense]